MKKNVLAVILIVIIFGFFFWLYQFFYLRKAHSTFEDYYAFRGCVTLLQRTGTYGVCKTKAGQTIKLVAYRGNWYLDNDLPTCVFGVCF